MARTLRPVIIGLAVLIVVVLAASGIAVAWFWRERRQVRELLAAEKGQPTEVVLKRMMRQRVHRDELAAVLFSREAVLEATPLPVLILDGDGRVVRVNAAARVALGGVDIGGLAAELRTGARACDLGRALRSAGRPGRDGGGRRAPRVARTPALAPGRRWSRRGRGARRRDRGRRLPRGAAPVLRRGLARAADAAAAHRRTGRHARAAALGR